ncbi:hypothetical protein I4F81_004812 [Pyropia yezoensis]|uniref:Uncharacterized protein n=1 Tax=Pyropia yezoensis TaxID=2788 RepID=A0ACC3BWK7_PYRYE|nr:hypothetical protein I4F81_004812 [Neopyropia yezoensis]
MTAGGSVPNATAVAAGVTGSAGRRPPAISSTSGGAREWLAEAVVYDPVEDSEVASWATGGRREHTLRRWALLAPLLTLYRNSPTATLLRDTSVFDVFATSRTTLGLCMDEECAIKIAVDTVRGGRPVVNTTSVPLLQFRGLDGLSMGVDMADGGLLSLGRSVWGQPPATPPGGCVGAMAVWWPLLSRGRRHAGRWAAGLCAPNPIRGVRCGRRGPKRRPRAPPVPAARRLVCPRPGWHVPRTSTQFSGQPERQGAVAC